MELLKSAAYSRTRRHTASGVAVDVRCLERQFDVLHRAQVLDADGELRGEGAGQLLVGPAEAQAVELVDELDDGDHLSAGGRRSHLVARVEYGYAQHAARRVTALRVDWLGLGCRGRVFACRVEAVVPVRVMHIDQLLGLRARAGEALANGDRDGRRA
eukprot:scaffold20828_cov47-Phaeocystis_antarctica.AAC.1